MAGCSVGVMTEPDCLGPCEPGTGVLLEAVIWHESNSGILVVNVSWKGRKYVGTLLDSKVHEWAPPSFRPDSPSRQQDNEAGNASPQKRKNRRGRGGRRNVPVPPSIPRTWGGDFKPHKNTFQDLANESRPEKRARCDIECPEQKCSKKFRCQNALEYHRIHAHVQNEIEASTPSKTKLNKQTRGIQTQTCDELHKKQPALPDLNTYKTAADGIAASHKDSKTLFSSAVTNKQTEGGTNQNDSVNNIKCFPVMKTHPSSVNLKGSEHSTNNLAANQSGKVLQMFASQKSSPVAGTVRPMLSTKHDVKKVGAPVAVLRPLVPQHMAKMSADKTIASLTTPTHTLTISSSEPQYRSVRPSQGVASTVMTTSTAFSKPTTSSVSAPVLPQSNSNAAFMGSTPPRSSKTEVSKGKAATPGGDFSGPKPQTPPSGSALSHRRDSSKSSHRGSRSNSMVSPNYSDISDASDGDMDTSQSDAIPPRINGEVEGKERQENQTAEERLYCNEELPSPSNTPGVKENDSSVSPLKNQSAGQHTPQPSPATSSQADTSKQSVPLHAVPPPQHIMYPYFPFMPNSQLSSVPMTGGAPMYAPPPYFMTYQGFPVMPSQGPPGMPQQMAPGQAFVAVSGSPGTIPHNQVPKTKSS